MIINESTRAGEAFYSRSMARTSRRNHARQQKAPPQERNSWNKVLLAVVLTVIALGTSWALHWRHMMSSPAPPVQMASEPTVSFGPTIPNTSRAPGPPPKGMAWISGGEFSMGAQNPPDMDDVGMKATIDSRPIHRVYVDGFYMDKTDVTNAEFSKFVKATGYITVAERTPRGKTSRELPAKTLSRARLSFLSGSPRPTE